MFTFSWVWTPSLGRRRRRLDLLRRIAVTKISPAGLIITLQMLKRKKQRWFKKNNDVNVQILGRLLRGWLAQRLLLMDFPLDDVDDNCCTNGEVTWDNLLIRRSQLGLAAFNFLTVAWGALDFLERQSVTDGFLPSLLPSLFPSLLSSFYRSDSSTERRVYVKDDY